MLSSQKSSFEDLLNPLIKPFARVDPNLLTLLGSIPSLLFFVFVLMHQYVWALVAMLGNGVDFLDGMVARKYGKVTAFGGFFDSVIDRVSDFLTISAFGFGGIVRWDLVISVLFVSFLISYIRSRGELASEKRVKIAIGLIERTERLLMLFFALLFYLFIPQFTYHYYNPAELDFIILLILSVITIAQRFAFAYRKLISEK